MIRGSLQYSVGKSKIKRQQFLETAEHSMCYSAGGAWLRNLDKCIKKPQGPSKQQLANTTMEDAMQPTPLTFHLSWKAPSLLPIFQVTVIPIQTKVMLEAPGLQLLV